MTIADQLRRILPGAIVLALVLLLARAILPPSQSPVVRGLVGTVVILSLLGAWLERHAPDRVPLRRDPAALVLVAALGVLLGLLLSHNQRVTSDGIDHFVYLRSLWIDHDLDLANDYEAVSPRRESVDPPTPIGRTGNLHPVGPALLWSPAYIAADVACRLAGFPPDGDGAPYRNAVALASVLYGWFGLVLLYRTALLWVDRFCAVLAALGIGFGTFLYWYLVFAPAMAHATAFGAAALFVWLWLLPLTPGVRRAALLGAACGLAALTRWPNALLALLPLFEALPRLVSRRTLPGLARDAGVFVLAALVIFSPQMLVWRLLYGSWVTIPQGSGFVAGPPAIAGVLFSPRHGLFSWSPLLYLGVAGLLWFLRHRLWSGLAALFFFGALTRVNAGVADWWGGAAFGARRFDALLPLLGLGLAIALAALKEVIRRRPMAPVVTLLGLMVFWNAALATQFRARAFEQADAVAFEDMGHGAVSLVDRLMGSPFSLPGSLLCWFRTGRSPAEYESLFMARRFNRWSVRFGLDDRLFLEDGWTAPRYQDGQSCRSIAGISAGLTVALHRPAPYTLGFRLAQSDPTAAEVRIRVFVNQQIIGALDVGPGWSDRTIAVPPETLRPGRNALRIKIVNGEPESVVFAGAWLEPAGRETP